MSIVSFSPRRLDGWTSVFLWSTVLTSVTGYFFPFDKLLPSRVPRAMSLVVLALAIYARYSRHPLTGWRRTHVIASGPALYLNVFVFIVQLCAKISALHELAPTPSGKAV